MSSLMLGKQAGLFSAVVTTFVAQTSQSLQVDYGQVTATLLIELIDVQRSASNGSLVNTIPRSDLTFHPSTSDSWVNGLWFTSLSLSLATALFAVLTKQWIPGVPGGIPGNRQQQAPLPQTPENKPAPIGAGVDKQKNAQLAESEPKSLGQAPIQATAAAANNGAAAPAPPVESKPSIEEVKATAASLATNGQAASAADDARSIPTGPRMARFAPAVPLPAALTNKGTPQAVKQNTEQSSAANAAALRDATQAAKAAVAVAMAKLEGSLAGPAQGHQPSNGSAMDNLTKKVNEMRVNAAGTGAPASRGGRGRGGRQAKVDVPNSDFDFASSNAKFNKEDIVKEAIAGASPLPDTPNGSVSDTPEVPSGNPPVAYNKSRSFFDNISSEAKERAENGGQKPGGREWRGEEQRKNMETFGQGSVDGGYRGYRGRGRGRGGRGFGRGRGGYRRNNEGPVASQ